ncbi:MAG TPA: DUF4157 domain-containing protein [Candidatus Angelobacter sp.]|nr:DUF4157 domain-containing protein [Candidatus Angelobacter sp.]
MSYGTRSRTKAGIVPAEKETFSKADHGVLRISKPEGTLEQEANQVASQITGDVTPEKYGWSFSNISVESQTEAAPPIVHDALRSSGQPLSDSSRAFFEPKLGRDLSDIRVHADEKAAESAQAVGARAYTVGSDIIFGREAGLADRRLLAHELTHTLQQERGRAPLLQRQPKHDPELKLLKDFAAKFPSAAALIKPNPAAMRLVKEASDAGATFGGFAEDGPSKDIGRAYTIPSGKAVYVPKDRGKIPVEAMRDFLFELNNAVHGDKFVALDAAAAKGQKTDATAAKKYAYDNAEVEVEGMLRLGEVWFETKAKYLGKKAHDFDKYDKQFFLTEYQAFKDHKKTKDEIVKDVLSRKYETGTIKGKTVEQFYIEEFQGLAK